LNFPTGIAVDKNGNVYVTEQGGHTSRKSTPGGVVTTLAGTFENYGSADGTGPAARFNVPWGIAVDAKGMLYVADYGNYTIRKITPTGVVTTLGGAPVSNGMNDATGSPPTSTIQPVSLRTQPAKSTLQIRGIARSASVCWLI
jgi:sugar lactone lactonase YvrE